MKNTAKSIGQFWINKLSLACACVVLGLGYATAQPAATAADTSITAIDILLLPDATMIQRAEAVNKRLRSVFPKGFSLDASHHPHISMFQCFVHTADLAKVFAAADKVFASGNVTNFVSLKRERILRAIGAIIGSRASRAMSRLKAEGASIVDIRFNHAADEWRSRPLRSRPSRMTTAAETITIAATLARVAA